MKDRRRPGFWWLFFYGRRRRGFPWLLAGLFAAAILLGLTFGIPGVDGGTLIGLVGVALIVLLLGAWLGLAAIAWLKPRGRR